MLRLCFSYAANTDQDLCTFLTNLSMSFDSIRRSQFHVKQVWVFLHTVFVYYKENNHSYTLHAMFIRKELCSSIYEFAKKKKKNLYYLLNSNLQIKKLHTFLPFVIQSFPFVLVRCSALGFPLDNFLQFGEKKIRDIQFVTSLRAKIYAFFSKTAR